MESVIIKGVALVESGVDELIAPPDIQGATNVAALQDVLVDYVLEIRRGRPGRARLSVRWPGEAAARGLVDVVPVQLPLDGLEDGEGAGDVDGVAFHDVGSAVIENFTWSFEWVLFYFSPNKIDKCDRRSRRQFGIQKSLFNKLWTIS